MIMCNLQDAQVGAQNDALHERLRSLMQKTNYFLDLSA